MYFSDTMPWKFGLQKVDSSYHTALLKKQLIDVIVNCVNLVAAGMLTYVVIVYTMQGGSLKIRDTKNFPGSVSPKKFRDNLSYNLYLHDLYDKHLKWNSGEFPYSPENMPAHCRAKTVCNPFHTQHGQIGKIEVLASSLSEFSILKCANGAAWAHVRDAYGFWKCGTCSKETEVCENSWSSTPSEINFDYCALSNPHLQFLNEVYYQLVVISAHVHPEKFEQKLVFPLAPNRTAVPIQKREHKLMACDAALELFDSASNETGKHINTDEVVCQLAANVSLEILEWIGMFCANMKYNSEQYMSLLFSLSELSESPCYDTDSNAARHSCCTIDSNTMSCSNASQCNSITSDIEVSLSDFIELLDLPAENSTLNGIDISEISIVTIDEDDVKSVLQFSADENAEACYLFTLYDSVDKVLLESSVEDYTCSFNISGINTESFAVLSGTRNENEVQKTSPDTRRKHSSLKQFRDHLASQIKTDALKLHKTRKKFAKFNTVKHSFYPILRSASVLAYIVSLTSFLATLATYGLFPKLRTERNSTKIKILLALCTCATLYIMTMCITIPFVSTSMGCQFALVMRVYLTLVTLTWSSIEAFYLYSAIVIIPDTYQSRFMRKALVVGLGVPAAIVFIPVASRPELFNGYVSGCDWICTFPEFTQFYLFLLPISIAFGLNLIIYGIAANFYLNNCSQFEVKFEQRKCAWDEIKACFGLFVLLVMSWLTSAFSVVNFSSEGPAISSPFELFCQILYILSIAGQGVYVFIVHCVAPLDARKQWIQIWKSFYVLRNSDKFFRAKNLRKGSKPNHGPVHHPKVVQKTVSGNIRDRSGNSKKTKKSTARVQSIPKITINSDFPTKSQASEV